MMDYHEKLLVDCVREKIKKEEIVNATKLSRVCRLDFRTVQNHFSSIVGKDLGDGTKILAREKCSIEYYRDSPEDGDESWSIIALVSTLGLVFCAAIGLAALAPKSHSEISGWVPVLSSSGGALLRDHDID
jgi:hypothetical protein